MWNDELWIGGPDGSLRDAAGDRRFALGAPIHALRPDGERLLISTNDGVWTLDRDAAPVPSPANASLRPIGEGYVTALAALPGGEMLVGGLNRGLWRLTPESPPARAAGLSQLGINRLTPAATGGWWAATTNGLFELDANLAVRRRITDREGLPHRYVASVVAEDQRVAIATSAGLAQLTATGMRAIDAFHGLAGNHLYCLARFRDGLAAGGLAGLSLIGGPDGLTPLRSFTGAGGGLPHNWVNAVLADGDRLLIGTYGGGIALLEGDGPPHAAPETAGVSANPEAALRYGDMVLFGTLTRGIALSRDARRWRFSERGLLSPNVTALAGTPDGLWIGADCGLARVPWDVVRQLLE
jgi:ligand-binding sensor domain-containing protein